RAPARAELLERHLLALLEVPVLLGLLLVAQLLAEAVFLVGHVLSPSRGGTARACAREARAPIRTRDSADPARRISAAAPARARAERRARSRAGRARRRRRPASRVWCAGASAQSDCIGDHDAGSTALPCAARRGFVCDR